MFESPAIAAPTVAQREGDGTPAPRRDRRLTLTRVSRRTRMGKRIGELTALFASAFSAADMTPMRRERIAEAAQLKAMAEAERGAWMRGEAKCDLDELVRLERRAVAAVKALGISEATLERKLSVPEYLALRDARRAQGV